MSQRMIKAGLVAVFAIGLLLTGKALWIPAKAQLAQWLLADAWEQSVQTGEAVKPWPWADHWPVARLHLPDLNIDQIVLAGDSGNVLAFGPGENMQAKALASAARIISGHRDTHFAFLRDVEIGQTLTLADAGSRSTFRIESVQVVDSAHVRLTPEAYPKGLILVTCYPFDTLTADGTQRLVVMASPIAVPEQKG
ncbi:MAG: class GN sortase [Oceanospirillales bacterium]|uniref:Sortase A n=1 Tax=Marinobacterium halophilum TaxID=267374 RepID=A0A2P8EZS5_9GAMM|nr:class GN sortase [Marinobacterium halophilum]MBR9829534.1 class GN sortase [Oceanospirillales bacterium]PSL14968.1 sortase A [Marinobacterium halophilum]